MDTTPSEVIAALLVALGLANRPNAAGSWPVIKGKLPDTPDQIISLYDTLPDQFGKDMRAANDGIMPNCQIRVRSLKYNLGWVKIRRIAKQLSQVFRQTVTTLAEDGTVSENVIVENVMVSSGPMHMGQEQTGNKENFTLNIQVSLEEAS